MTHCYSLDDRHIDDYNKPSALNCRHVADNYRRRLYAPPVLEKMPPMYKETHGPLLKINRKGEVQEAKTVWKWDTAAASFKEE